MRSAYSGCRPSSCRRAATTSRRSARSCGRRWRDWRRGNTRRGCVADIGVEKDEAEGIPAQPRKDVKPPPHWRLEAVAATERPRSLSVGADRGTAVFIQDRDTSDVWLIEIQSDAMPQRLTTGRDP